MDKWTISLERQAEVRRSCRMQMFDRRGLGEMGSTTFAFSEAIVAKKTTRPARRLTLQNQNPISLTGVGREAAMRIEAAEVAVARIPALQRTLCNSKDAQMAVIPVLAANRSSRPEADLKIRRIEARFDWTRDRLPRTLLL